MKRRIKKKFMNPPDDNNNGSLFVEFAVHTPHKIECDCCNGSFAGLYHIQVGSSSVKLWLCNACYHRLLAKMYSCSEQMLDLSTDNVKTGGV